MLIALYKILYSLSDPAQKRTFVTRQDNTLVLDWAVWLDEWHYRQVHRIAEGPYVRRELTEYPAFKRNDLLLQVLLCSPEFRQDFPLAAKRLDAFTQLLFAEPLTDETSEQPFGEDPTPNETSLDSILTMDICLRYRAFRRSFHLWCANEKRVVLSCVNSALSKVRFDQQPSDQFCTIVSLGYLKTQLESHPTPDGFILTAPVVFPPPLRLTADQERSLLVAGLRHSTGVAIRMMEDSSIKRDPNYTFVLLRNVLAHIWESGERIEGLPFMRFPGQGPLSVKEEYEKLPILREWFETHFQTSPRMVDLVSRAMPAVSNELPNVIVYYRYHKVSLKRSRQQDGHALQKTYKAPLLPSGDLVEIYFSRFVIYIDAEPLGLKGIDLINRVKQQKDYIHPTRTINDRPFVSFDFAMANTEATTRERLVKHLSGHPDAIKRKLTVPSLRAKRTRVNTLFTHNQDAILWELASRVLLPMEKRAIPTLFIEHRSYRTTARYRLIKEIYAHGGDISLLKDIPMLKERVGAKALKANYQAFTAEERKAHLLLFFNPSTKKK
jgi:hypothetical protein